MFSKAWRWKEDILRNLSGVLTALLTDFPAYLLSGFVSSFCGSWVAERKSLPWAHCWWKTKIKGRGFSTSFLLSSAVSQSPPAGPVPASATLTAFWSAITHSALCSYPWPGWDFCEAHGSRCTSVNNVPPLNNQGAKHLQSSLILPPLNCPISVCMGRNWGRDNATNLTLHDAEHF